MRTRGEARAEAIRRLRAGADPHTAPLDADVLLAFTLGVGKEDLFAHPERPLDPAERERFEALVERRAGGEPVAYLRGFKEFYGLRLRVDRRVLIPRPETETLVAEAVAFIGGRPLRVADVGTGSGAIACAIAIHAPSARVVAIDASVEALAVAGENAAALGVVDRIELRHGDLLASVAETVDVVCANLPYLAEDALAQPTGERASLAFEPRLALAGGADGLTVIIRAIADLPRVLAPSGAAFFECDPPQADAVARALADVGLETGVVRDLAGDPRVVRALARPPQGG